MSELEGEQPFVHNLREYQRLINARLQRVLSSNQPSTLYKPIEYILDGGGKRVRPILLVLCCQAVGGNVDCCMDAVVAVELLHNFSLVHDDIMDRDSTRRGRATVHTRWNSDVALLAGDALFGLAYRALLQTESKEVHRICKIFTDGVMELCEGQSLDSEYESRPDIKLADYLLMIRKKTACLLSMSSQIGAILGGGNTEEEKSLRDFGLNLGCAFQIQDDLLDITSEEETSGKTFGSDVKRGKKTFLLVHALGHSDGSTSENLSKMFSNSHIERSQIIQVRELFQQAGSLEAARTAISEYLSSARKNLRIIRPSKAREDLENMLGYLSRREA